MTLRRLVRRAESKRRAAQAEAWDRTSALIWAVFRAAGNRGVKPQQFNPIAQKRADESSEPVGIEILKAIFVDKRVPDGHGK